MEDLVEDAWARSCDDGGERCHCVVVGHLLIGSTFPLFLSMSNITSVMSSDATLRAAEIMEWVGSGGGRLGILGMRILERVLKRDGFIFSKECPRMPPANVEGKVSAHVLSTVCQRRTEAFVG